jgi:hypothetical protein
MIITKAQIHLAAAKGKDRPILNNVHYRADKRRLEAVDGFVLASVPVALAEGEEPSDCMIPVEAVKEVQKMARVKSKSPKLEIDGERVTASAVPAYPDGETANGPTVTYNLYTEGKFPDTDQINPPPSGLQHLVTLDVKRLYDLARAICEDDNNTATADLFVNLYQGESKGSPVVVEPLDGYAGSGNRKCAKDHTPSYSNGAYGLIMPLHHE